MGDGCYGVHYEPNDNGTIIAALVNLPPCLDIGLLLWLPLLLMLFLLLLLLLLLPVFLQLCKLRLRSWAVARAACSQRTHKPSIVTNSAEAKEAKKRDKGTLEYVAPELL